MNLDFYLPVRIVSGIDCVRKGRAEFRRLGERCLVITGGNSAKASGALDDVTAVLKEEGISFEIFSGIEENPKMSSCARAADRARAFGAQFLVGIGGGSPLDATKAIAVLAANRMENPYEIYDYQWEKPALPFALVGLTAGTGSEVTAFSVISNDTTNRKRSIRHPQCYASVAFCDPKYTYSLPLRFTVSTALDALCHAVEGYFGQNATNISDQFALKAVSLLQEALTKLDEKGEAALTPELREKLYYASIYAGITLNTCMTGFCHPCGYFLTEEHGVPHGFACAVFLPAYIERGCRFYPQKGEVFSNTVKDRKQFEQLVRRLNEFVPFTMDDAQIEAAAERIAASPNFKISPGGFNKEDAVALYRSIFPQR